MNTYIEFNDKRLYLPSDCTFNRSNAWSITEKRSTDSTNSIQNIVYLQKKGLQPTTYQISFVLMQSEQERSLFDLLPEYEQCIGAQATLSYSGRIISGLVVSEGSFTITTDAAVSAVALSISLNLCESLLITPQTPQRTSVNLSRLA